MRYCHYKKNNKSYIYGQDVFINSFKLLKKSNNYGKLVQELFFLTVNCYLLGKKTAFRKKTVLRKKTAFRTFTAKKFLRKKTGFLGKKLHHK